MIKKVTKRTTYVCLPFIRLIWRDGQYVGWYKPGRRRKHEG